MTRNFFIPFVLFLIIGVVGVLMLPGAQAVLPPALQKIVEYNNQETLSFAANISFIIAFVAGMLGILSPCILPFLPAYLSYTFKGRKQITVMTIVFFLGFATVFVLLGLLAGFLGERSLAVLKPSWLARIAGFVIVALGFLTILGKEFGGPVVLQRRWGPDALSTFLFGCSFAVGWSACVGPILTGILGIGALLHQPVQSAMLLFFYALGNFVPLFVLALTYDTLHLERLTLLRGKLLHVSLLGKSWDVHSWSFVGGILLVLFGLFVIGAGGTAPVNTLDPFATKQLFYDTQRILVSNSVATIVGSVVMIVLGLLVWLQLRKPAEYHEHSSGKDL